MNFTVIWRSLFLACIMATGAIYCTNEWIQNRIAEEEYDPWSAYEQMPVQQSADDMMNPTPKPDARPLSLDPRRSLGRYPGDEGKNHTRLKAAFKPVVSKSNSAAVTILCDGKDKALGTIISETGEIVTKASELQGEILVQLQTGKKYPAKVVSVMREHDLALLKINSDKLTPIRWREGSDPAIGSFLVSVNTSDEPVAIGVLSVTARKISVPSGLLGIMLDQTPNGPVIIHVLPDSAAEAAGLKNQDLVQQVNDKSVKTREELIETISNFRPGDKLILKVKRGDQILNIDAVLGRPETGRPSNAPGKSRRTEDERLAGDLSERRGGFPNVLQHDTVLRPNQMGGPLVDLDGKAVGINIARADRVASYALPARVVLTVLNDMRAGKYPAPTELQGDNRERLQAQIKSLEDAIKAAEKTITSNADTVKKAKDEITGIEKKLAEAKAALSGKEAALKEANAAKTKAADELKSAQERLKKLPSDN
jgi:serine protease Do